MGTLKADVCKRGAGEDVAATPPALYMRECHWTKAEVLTKQGYG